jgi:lipopolysaccharide/colanic/teichoic acid biosynthesis glycosyltransferase
MRLRIAKRALDIVVSLAGLIVLAPVLTAVAIAVRLLLYRPVLFRQIRPGLLERPFVMYKFRSMRELVDANGVPLPDEKRLHPFGLFLRRTSLDELPELWNVLKGEMSLVGPRPLLPGYLPRYNASQRRRHEAKPGITGWAQVNGRNALSWQKKLELDVWYVDHRSFGLDLKILCLTVFSVLRRDGISQAGHMTMPEFLGTQDCIADRLRENDGRD